MHETAGLLGNVRTQADRGDFPAIVRLLETVPRGELLREPELGYYLAYAWRRTGHAREALILVRELDVPVRRAAAEWLARRRLNLEAMLQYDAGDFEGAARTWEQVAELAGRAGDAQLLAAAHNNLGVVHTLQDRIDLALTAYQRALLAGRALGDRRLMAQAHQNLAIVYRELRHAEAAEASFQEALQLARLSGHEDVRGRVEEERALLQLEQGDAALARATAEHALRRFTAIDDAAGEGEARRVLGIIALRERDLALAGEQLVQALERARGVPNPLLEAEAEEALAVLAVLRAEPTEARAHRGRAEALFSSMGAAPWGRRIRASTAALAAVSGDG